MIFILLMGNHEQNPDRNVRAGLRTKNVIIVGYPVVIFCSAKFEIDQQEKTRVFLLSPETSTEKIRDAIILLSKKLSSRDEYKTEIETDEQSIQML